ncbi:MAG: DUF3750 domain-containing protein [Caldithrix sp.]|nr:DUF3750 domain-containing protein [Caldithrix sp.]
MNIKKLKKEIADGQYHVLLMTCPATLPVSFAIHPWFVCAKGGRISRWEVRFERNNDSVLGKHLYKDGLPPFSGIEMVLPLRKKLLWGADLFMHFKGGRGSMAQEMYDFINGNSGQYPYRDQYSLFGPNSNTYAQWVLDSLDILDIKLPWNCIGKSYHQ